MTLAHARNSQRRSTRGAVKPNARESARVHPTARRFTDYDQIVPLIACCTDAERHHGHADRVIHDALQPAAEQGRWRRSSFAHIYPENIRQRVLAAWPN